MHYFVCYYNPMGVEMYLFPFLDKDVSSGEMSGRMPYVCLVVVDVSGVYSE